MLESTLFCSLCYAGATARVLQEGVCSLKVGLCMQNCCRTTDRLACSAHSQVGEPPANSLRLQGAKLAVSPFWSMHMHAALEA